MPSTCPYCEWSDHAYRLPAHILSRHIEHIRIGTIQRNHCLNAFVRPGGDGLVEFSVCLTCKKGTVADTTEGNGMRWLSLHSKKDACRAAHAAAYTTFKAAWDAAKAAPAEEPAPPPSGDSIASLWEECKTNKKMSEMVADLEDRVLEESECLDDDPCFRPEEGFKVAISTAIGYKQKFEKSKQKMEELVAKHDDEIRELRGVIRKQVDTIQRSETMIKDHQYEIAHLRVENSRLQKEIEELQDENNALRVEISQLRAEITQLREENGTLRSEVGSLKDEMALMREQMVAMQKEFDAYKKAHPV